MDRRLRLAIRLFAVVDFVPVTCFAVPVLAGGFIGAIGALGAALGLAGITPPATALGWLFVHIAGVLGVLWALVRGLAPSALLAGLDSVGRCAVAALIVYAIAARHASGVLGLFVASELIGALVQGALLGRAARAASVNRP